MTPRIALALPVLLGLAAAEEESDVIVMKDGSRRIGFIVEESYESVVLKVVLKGRKGETVVAGKVTVPREQIAEIRRMDDAARKKELERAEAFEDREWKREERQRRIAVTTMTVAGRPGRCAAGDLFVVRTTCDEEFAREACDALQQSYEGYLRHFKLRRRTRQKLPVIILRGREQYDAYLRSTYGMSVRNPALYDSKRNVIVAYNFIQEEEEAAAKEFIRGKQKEIEDLRKAVVAAEKRVDEQARKARADIRAEAQRARSEVRRADPGNRPALMRKIAAWEKDRLETVHHQRMKADKYLADLRRKTSDAIEACRRAIRQNEKTLRDQNRTMFEVLFHECFHAFVRNRLFRDTEIPRWLNEGMASYYEMSVVEDGELIHGSPNISLVRAYRELSADGRLPRLASVLRAGGDVFAVQHGEESDRSTGTYAVAWALAHYLTTNTTPDQMDAYISAVETGADAAVALSDVLGQPLWKLDEALKAHVASLPGR